MARKILPLFLVPLVSIFIGCGGSVTPVASHSNIIRSGTVFVGDSIFGRWDLDSYFPGKGYVNAGWFGQRTDQILAVFPAILDGSNVCHGYIPIAPNPPDPAFPFSCESIPAPAQIVILLGWNDMFQNRSTVIAYSNIHAMAAKAKAQGVKVVLVVPYRFDSAHPASWMQPFSPCAPNGQYPFSDNQEPVLNAGIKAAAAELSVPVVDLESVFCLQSDYTVDGVHPNVNGYQQMHDAIKDVL